MNSVYVLISEKDKRSYIGSTTCLSRRIGEHNSGKCRATKHRMPLRLVYDEEFDTVSDARRREKYLKTSPGRRELKKIFDNIAHDWE